MPNLFRSNKPAKTADRDATSKKCRANIPATCRYHGVPQPGNQTDALKKAETAADDLNTQRFDLYIEARLGAEEHFKRYIAGGENGFPNFGKAKGLMGKIYTPDEVNEENFKKVQDAAYQERLEQFKTYSDNLADTIFSGDKDAIFIAQNGTKDHFAYSQAQKNKYPITFFSSPKEDQASQREVRAYAREHGLTAGMIEDGNHHRVYTVIDSSAYTVPETKYEALISDEKYARKFFAYKKTVERIWAGESTREEVVPPVPTLEWGLALGRSY